MKPKKYHYINSFKKSDMDLLKELLRVAGIEVTDKQSVKLYSLFCNACGTEFFTDNVLKPVVDEARISYKNSSINFSDYDTIMKNILTKENEDRWEQI